MTCGHSRVSSQVEGVPVADAAPASAKAAARTPAAAIVRFASSTLIPLVPSVPPATAWNWYPCSA